MKKLCVLFILAALMLTVTACGEKEKITYTSSFTMYVNHWSDLEDTSITSEDIKNTQSLVDTYAVIITSTSTLEEVIEYGELSMTAEELRKMISISPINETEIFTVRVTTEDPQLAKNIADAIADVAPEAIARIVEGTSPRILDAPGLPTQPDRKR